MIKARCLGCGKDFPTDETFEVQGRVLCKDCAQRELAGMKDIPEGAVSRRTDPTVCFNCGTDNGSHSLPLLAGLPACDRCVALLRNRPFPRWVKVSFAGLAALVLFSLGWNLRFIRAYREMREGFRVINLGEVEEAEALLRSASEQVPESPDLKALAAFSRGLLMLSRDRSAEALAALEECRDRMPPGAGVDTLILQARAGVSFDRGDWDGFLDNARALLEADPGDQAAMAQVASALACKYAVTGDEALRTEARRTLERAGASSPADPHLDEYAQRILYRLHSREIIDREEFERRFPQGWSPPEEAR